MDGQMDRRDVDSNSVLRKSRGKIYWSTHLLILEDENIRLEVFVSAQTKRQIKNEQFLLSVGLFIP